MKDQKKTPYFDEMKAYCKLDHVPLDVPGHHMGCQEDELKEFLSFSLSRAGASELLTPREMIRDFMTLLQILSENENASFDALLHAKQAEPADVAEESDLGLSLSDFSL